MKRTKPKSQKILLNNKTTILEQDNRDAVAYLRTQSDKFIGIQVNEEGASRITGINRSGSTIIEVINKYSVQLNFYNSSTKITTSKVLHFQDEQSLEKGIDKIYSFVDNNIGNYKFQNIFN